MSSDAIIDSKCESTRTEVSELVAQVVDNVQMHLEHARALDQLVGLAHRRVARQRTQV